VVELYGTLDPVTRDWTDGLLSCIFREINKPTDKNERKYIVFDGDVDALWVENMNSVMDDNRLLTLANGERIRLQKHCALLFEVSRYYKVNMFWSMTVVERSSVVELSIVGSLVAIQLCLESNARAYVNKRLSWDYEGCVMDSSNLSLVVFLACFIGYSQVQIFDWQFGRLL